MLRKRVTKLGAALATAVALVGASGGASATISDFEQPLEPARYTVEDVVEDVVEGEDSGDEGLGDFGSETDEPVPNEQEPPDSTEAVEGREQEASDTASEAATDAETEGAPDAATDSTTGVGKSRTLTNAELCSPTYFNAGVVTINMSAFSGIDSLTVGEGNTISCALDVTGLVFTGKGPTSLTIGERAFSQETRGADSKLATLTFPQGLTSLTIGARAFHQEALGGGDNALTSVVFPEGLKSVVIGERGFSQISTGEGNALATLSFPERLDNLEIGYYAFSQLARGGNNALATVVFPEGLADLVITNHAFYQYAVGANAMSRIVFPWEFGNLTIEHNGFGQRAYGIGTNASLTVIFPHELPLLTLDSGAFFQERLAGPAVRSMLFFPVDARQLSWRATIRPRVANEDTVWVWLGPDASSTHQAWGGKGGGDFPLHGTRIAQFDGAGGKVVGSDKMYVFPTIDGEPQAVPLSDVFQLDPSAFLDPEAKFSVPMPEVSRTEPAGITFTGWCEGSWEDEKCSSGPYSAGTIVPLSKVEPTRFVAGWEDPPPKEFTISFNLVGGEGDFPNIVAPEGSRITLPWDVPTREGFTFLGWAYDDDMYYPGGELEIPSRNLSLTAQWMGGVGGEGGVDGPVGGTVGEGFDRGPSAESLPRTGAQVWSLSLSTATLLLVGVALTFGTRTRKARG